MDRLFPFGFDSHMAFYLIVYVLSLVVHVFLMAYVLAGSCWLAWTTLCPGQGTIPRGKQPLALILRDWMPFALSGAITAGVAPLLFVQILYRQQFYSANLLLGWRWMVVIPVLVAAFYLLYVIKSKAVSHWAFSIRLALSISVAACFLFMAFCWTANHLLSLDESLWPEAYRSREAVKSVGTLSLRLLTWIFGAFPTMSVLASWQLRGMRTRTKHWDATITQSDWMAMFDVEHRRLAIASMAGFACALITAMSYALTLDRTVASQFTSSVGLPWLLLAVASIMIQVIGWFTLVRRWNLSHRWLCVITGALSCTLVATASLREIVRLSHADLGKVAVATQAAANVGGFELFVVFTAMNIGLMVWCIRLVSRSTK